MDVHHTSSCLLYSVGNIDATAAILFQIMFLDICSVYMYVEDKCGSLFVPFYLFPFYPSIIFKKKNDTKEKGFCENIGFDQKEHQQFEWLKNKDEKGRKEEKIGAAKI